MPTILCVDDRERTLASRRQLLEVIGYRTLTATSARAAVRLFRREPIDLAILDYCLGDINGDALARHIRKRFPRVPVIMVSGDPAIPADAIATADAFIPKGQRADKLLRTVARYLPAPPRACRGRRRRKNVAPGASPG